MELLALGGFDGEMTTVDVSAQPGGGERALAGAAADPDRKTTTADRHRLPRSTSRPLLVAAETDAPGGPRAHATADVGSSTARHGVSLCGYPNEHLTILAGMAWEQVNAASRCPHCQDDLTGADRS